MTVEHEMIASKGSLPGLVAGVEDGGGFGRRLELGYAIVL